MEEKCPKCGGKKDPQHPKCWHCIDCPYTKCADEVFEPEVKKSSPKGGAVPSNKSTK